MIFLYILIFSYLLIGVWMTKFWATKINLELKNIPCDDRAKCNHIYGANGPNKDWGCADSKWKILIRWQFLIWLPTVIYEYIISPSAIYVARELTEPRENV